MITQEDKTEMLNKLNMLGNGEQEAVLNFISSLITRKTKGVKGKSLLSFAGTIDSNDLEQMKRTIEEDCERVNLNDW
ncbi:MAG: hypothetical protein ACE5GV_15320 [Candidatus Scalindua sp.]